jgi:hypothetical protein
LQPTESKNKDFEDEVNMEITTPPPITLPSNICAAKQAEAKKSSGRVSTHVKRKQSNLAKKI